jgi:hypothetical protein
MSKLKTRVVPFNDATQIEDATRMLPVIKAAFDELGPNSEQAARTILSMWRTGSVKLIEQVPADDPTLPAEGVAALMVTPSLLHATDGLLLLFAPHPDYVRQLIDFAVMVAAAHGTGGISLTLPAQPTSYVYLDVLVAAGFSAKAVVYGKGLA